MSCLLVVFLAGCKTNSSIEIKDMTKGELTNTPTLFVHGYGGGKGSMKGMIKRFEKANIAKRDMLITVSPRGDVTVENEQSLVVL